VRLDYLFHGFVCSPLHGVPTNFMVAPDEQRFLILTPVDYESASINVVVNWRRALKH
jgi:hypothetical protein